MADAAELVKSIKKAAAEAVKAEKPVEVCFGKVTSAAPLKILVEQKMELGAAQLVISQHLTDYECEMTLDHCTESDTSSHTHTLAHCEEETEETELTHCHRIKGRKSFVVHNGLAVGDEVILLRQQGGQKYIVWDRIKR